MKVADLLLQDAQVLTEIVSFLDARSAVRFVTLFSASAVRPSDALSDPVFYPSTDLLNEVIVRGLKKAGIITPKNWAPFDYVVENEHLALEFETQLMGLSVVSRLYSAIASLQPETDTVFPDEVPVRKIVCLESPLVTLALPCKVCSGSWEGSCTRTVFKVCADCYDVRDKCFRHEDRWCGTSDDWCDGCVSHIGAAPGEHDLPGPWEEL